MHHLLNVVTNIEGSPHAVLIRALHPTDGIETMLKRRNKSKLDKTLTSGPGSVCQALGLTFQNHNGHPFDQKPLWIEDRGVRFSPKEIQASRRIGIDYAEEDALLPWRFTIKRAEKGSNL